MLAVFAYNVRKNFAAHGTRLDFLPLESFTDTFARTIPCIVARGEFLAANFARSDFDGAGTFGNFFAFGRAVGVVTAIGGFIFAPAVHTDKLAAILAGLRAVLSGVNAHVHGFRQRFQIRDVVVVFVEVFVVNVVTVGNFAVVASPNHAMKTEQFEIASFHSRRIARAISYTVELLMRIVNNFNTRQIAFDLANHFFDGERFLRSLARLAQRLEKFFLVFHGNASKF